MIRATLKYLPEEAEAVALFARTEAGRAQPGGHLWRGLLHLADTLAHEMALKGHAAKRDVRLRGPRR